MAEEKGVCFVLMPFEDTSAEHNREYWNNLQDIDPGKICGWIFTYEEKGRRMKA